MPINACAAVLAAPETIRLHQVELDDPGSGEVVVEIQGCGVCASNIPPFEGREWFDYPFEPGAPGHEAWGIVREVGRDVTGLREGQRVASLGQRGYATHDIVAAAQVVPLPERLDDMPFPGEPLGCAMNIFRRSNVRAGQTVAIVGAGFLGTLLTGLCESVGARVIAISRRPFSRQMAEKFGAAHTIPMEDHWEILEEVSQLTDGKMCERAIECVGKQWPLDLAAELVATRGTLVVAGYHQDGARQVDMQSWNWRGLDVINAHERDPAVYVDGMRAAVQAVLEERIDPRPLFTHTFALQETGAALRAACERESGFMKAIVSNELQGG